MTLNCNTCHHPILAIGQVRESSAICVACYIEELKQQIQRVRSVHTKALGKNGKGWDCLGCPDGNGWFEWPCPTIIALEGEQE